MQMGKNMERPVMETVPLLTSDTMNGVVDYCGRPASRVSTGGWTSAFFIMGVEISERFAYYGVSSNLITYLTGQLHESTAEAVAALNVWPGVSSMLPLLGALLGDSYLGRYRTVVVSSILYVAAIGTLSFSTLLQPPKCEGICRPSSLQVFLFYSSLYAVAFAEAGHKPCVQAFGADQFEQEDPKERTQRGTYFNWRCVGVSAGAVVTFSAVNYIQDNIGWGLGFGIPCIAVFCSLFIFLLGTKIYRFHPIKEDNPFARLGKTLLAWGRARRRWRDDIEQQRQHSTANMDELKTLFRLFPMWATSLPFAVVYVQSTTLFTKQGSTLDRRINASFEVPPAALQTFISISIITFMPIYDKILVPAARKFSNHSSGLTMLQRIGSGMAASLTCMVAAALVEMRRLRTARELGLEDDPRAVIPMSLWWLVPQYVLCGVACALTVVGLQEFFYDQISGALRSLGIAHYLSIFGAGNFISGFLILLINYATSTGGRGSWFADNLNRAHLDYFYWLLAGSVAIELAFFAYCARAYVYQKK